MAKDPIDAGADVLEKYFGEKGGNEREFYRQIVREIYSSLEPTQEMIGKTTHFLFMYNDEGPHDDEEEIIRRLLDTALRCLH